jgi:hypothetical protein
MKKNYDLFSGKNSGAKKEGRPTTGRPAKEFGR